MLSNCGGQQSALNPAGHGAELIAGLFWAMAAGSILICIAVFALTFYFVRVHKRRRDEISTYLIVGGGAVGPTAVLTILLVYGLALLPDLVGPAPAGSLKIAVTGEQWWWRVAYHHPDGETVELANEIRLPVGEAAEFHLRSADVVHSFWIPALGGKMDMFPGRTTRLVLKPTRTGVFRGVCAEYCGVSHAFMSFPVVVESREAFLAWLTRQRQPARLPAAEQAARGQELFLFNGCNACHRIRGTAAAGVIGPDLTHVGSRLTIGAGLMPNEPDELLRWIAHTDVVKPAVHMPEFAMLSAGDLGALVAYLRMLE